MDGKKTIKRRIAVLFICVFAAMSLGVYASRGPWQEFRREKEKSNDAVAEMEKIESRRRDLMDERSRYKSNKGREELARERGYRRPDEEPIEIPR